MDRVFVLLSAIALSHIQEPQIDTAAAKTLIQACKESNSTGLVVMQNGKVVIDEGFGHKIRAANLMSATKSITSMAVGLLLDSKKIPSVDTPVQRFFPEYKGKWKDKITVRMLLEHTSGIQTYAVSGRKEFPKNRVASALIAPIDTEPGKVFEYNNRAVDLLSGLVRRVSGVPLDKLVEQRIFRPLGIDAYYWDKDPDGNPHGCAELILQDKDLAKIGQLMLDKGVWQGKRLISEQYIAKATVPSKITEGTGNSCGWLWWNVDPWFTITEDGLKRLSKAGYTDHAINLLRPLVGQSWPNYREMQFEVVVAWTYLGYQEMPEFELSRLVDNAPNPDRQGGFYANGWGGQWLLVLPKQNLVAVRLCGDGFFKTDDGSKFEMGNFYRLVKALTPTK